jgi:hypothetical protein
MIISSLFSLVIEFSARRERKYGKGLVENQFYTRNLNATLCGIFFNAKFSQAFHIIFHTFLLLVPYGFGDGYTLRKNNFAKF